MKKYLFLFALTMGSTVYSQELTPPGLEFVCELKVTTDETRVVGKTAHGERRIIPITGGTFEGPKLKGTVLSGGADYQFVNPEKTRTEIEAIYSVETDDGVLIHIRNEGVVFRTPQVMKKLEEGNPPDWDQIYFRAAPKFEAPLDSPYNWMNNAIFVCKGVPMKGYVSIQVWQVL
ncbi:DUF3237 domain-containing protein [Maribacter sp. CXY002]|uniref:DUF3237 domain-containing protein n=1 Tax=Maribacter luteocoastalis TaxID=3407671 RepID=UPI003B67B91E